MGNTGWPTKGVSCEYTKATITDSSGEKRPTRVVQVPEKLLIATVSNLARTFLFRPSHRQESLCTCNARGNVVHSKIHRPTPTRRSSSVPPCSSPPPLPLHVLCFFWRSARQAYLDGPPQISTRFELYAVAMYSRQPLPTNYLQQRYNTVPNTSDWMLCLPCNHWSFWISAALASTALARGVDSCRTD